MKIRSDFVTNSSSSSFCVMNVKLKNGEDIHWEDEYCKELPIFEFPSNVEDEVKEIRTIEDLLEFLNLCAQHADSNEDFAEECDSFITSIKKIKSIDEIESLEMEWGIYESDQGVSPEEGCDGGQLKYQFDNGDCEVIFEASEDFIDEMNCQFGYDDDENDDGDLDEEEDESQFEEFSAPTSVTLSSWTTGDVVFHAAFGKGTILQVMPLGKDTLLKITFDDIGTKMLMASTASAHLRKL